MGAFDGLNFYQTRPVPQPVMQDVPKSKEGFYVSYDGTNGGATGRWFKKRELAIKFFMEKVEEKKHPSTWFDAPELNNVNTRCGQDRCIICNFREKRKCATN